jgi:hypothetical protein
MALPQSIDPTTLNISGKPNIPTVAPLTTTSAGASGMPMPSIVMEKPEIPIGAGALLGYALGNLTGVRPTTTGTGTGTGTGTPSGGGASSGGGAPSGGGTPTGNIGSVNSISLPAGTTQAQIDAQYGTTNGQSNYQISGVNMTTGEVVATPNYNIGGTNLGTNTGNFGFEAGTGTGGGTTTGGLPTTPTDTTQTANQYFQDSQGNIYDAEGTLIYINPSRPISGGTIDGGGYDPNATDTTSGGTSLGQPSQYLQDAQGNVYDENGTLIYYNPSNVIPGTNDGGGGYDPSAPETEQYYEDSSGNIFDYSGNLVLEYGNGYYYEPDTGNFYDSNFDVVGDDFSAYQDFFGIPTYDSSAYDDYDFSDLFDYGNYTSGSTTYIKDGGSVRSGLATPLFRKGGSVPKFEDGGFINQVVANQMPQSVATTSTPTTTSTPVTTSGLTNPVQTNTSQSGIVNTISNLLGNKGVSGALLGTLIAQLLNTTEQPVNRGVDMTALGRLAPRTTPTGPTRFVPYSEYGTPTTPFDYSKLYENLGVSPFGAGAGALSPSATPTTSASAQPVTVPTVPTAPTTPMGGLPAVTAPVAPSAPQYFQDADGNVYNANGDLVYDTTTGTTTPTAQQPITPSGTAQASVAPMSGLAVTTPEASSASYYSYGSDVNPAQVLSSKKGGAIRKFADGGLSDLAVTSLSDVIEPMMVEAPMYDYSDRMFNPKGGVTYNAETGIATDSSGHTMDVSDFVGTYGTHPSNFTPDFYGSASPLDLDPKELYSILSKYPSMEYMADPNWQASQNAYSNALALNPTSIGFGDKTLLETEPDLAKFYPEYRGGMPVQTTAMPTQGPAMPTQGSAMPTQGPAMPSQAPFSDSPTFMYSGARNPLLAGLSMTPRQPYTLAEGGSPHSNPNIPTTASESHNPNVPIVQGRQDYRKGAYVQGAGDGQSDDIPAMLADGEYVIDAETVAQLGNGSNKAGAKMLDEFRENIRAHKRSAPTHKIPPKSKSPLAYLKGAK